jgi:hypothetical protein
MQKWTARTKQRILIRSPIRSEVRAKDERKTKQT